MNGATPPATAPWRPLDCHAHTTWSDGELRPDDLVDTVRARGVRPSISDHVSRDVPRAVKSPDMVQDYLDELEHIPGIARGAEFCWHDNLWRELPAVMIRRFTHCLGSLHGVILPDGTLVHMFQRDFPSGLTPEAYMDAHVTNLEQMTREMPIEIHSHPTLLPLALRGIPLDELWTEPHERRAVAALEAAGVAFEISNRYRPHERFVRRAIEAGVRISLGSDGHSREQVGDLAWPLALARALGVRDQDLYDPFVHGSRARRSESAVSR